MRQVIAEGSNVERQDGRAEALHLAELVGDALGQRHAAGLHAGEQQVAATMVLFNNLKGDARERTPDGCLVHDLCGLLGHWHTPFLLPGTKKASCPKARSRTKPRLPAWPQDACCSHSIVQALWELTGSD